VLLEVVGACYWELFEIFAGIGKGEWKAIKFGGELSQCAI
jgi:hypothetical protein